MYGWQGIILRVDLTGGRITKEPLSKELAHKYIGGRGLNAKLLYDEVKPGTDSLGPNNKLIFGVGPACGTLVPGSQRWTATCKATLSNFLSDTSCGSSFGPALKYAGYDGIIVEGKSDRPVYLLINGDNVSIKDASHLWGKTTTETEKVLEKEIGTSDARIVSIGQAGENLVKFSSIVGDKYRVAARAGGAVMGSKNLKAIATMGNKGVKVADRRMLEKAVKETYQMWSTDFSQQLKEVREVGNFLRMAGNAELGVFGTRNFQNGIWPEYRLKIAAPAIKRHIGHRACFSCPGVCFTCAQYAVTEGPYAGVTVTNCATPARTYTAQIGNSDVDFMFKLHSLSDEYGIDEMSTGAVISFAMECYEAGILNPSELSGLKLEWGNSEAISELFDMIVNRKGIGNILAEGATSAAKVIGKESEKFVMAVKGQPVDYLEPRAEKGLALGYAVASGGGGHNRAKLPMGSPDLPKDTAYLKRMFQFEGRELNTLHEEPQSEIFKWYEDVNAFANMLETCLFFLNNGYPRTPRFLANMYNAVTGLNISIDDVFSIGERVVNLEKAFNIRQGWTRKDDTLPDRFTKEPMPDGWAKGQIVNIEPMISKYYELRGWDKDTGIPTRKKLEELGLEEVAHDIL